MRTQTTLQAQHRALRAACEWTALLMLVCGAAVLAHCDAAAAPLSMHVARLSPALSLLSWSAPSIPSWLSLSLDPHSGSPLSLPPHTPSHLIVSGGSASAAAAFTLCESNTERSSPSSSTPLCAHAILHTQSAAEAMDGSAWSLWDLSGARLHAELTRSPDRSSAHRVSWAAPAVSSSPAAPPLLYSLFAEWTAPTVDAAAMHAPAATHRAAPEPTLRRHSIRMCSAQSHDQRTTLHCDIEEDRLPRGVELTLHLLTECDYQRINAEAGSSLTHCLSTVSPELRVTLDSLLPVVSLPAALAPISFTAAPGVTLVANDTAVRQALCVFYTQTSGPQWITNSGWCDPTVPICGNATQSGWFGVGCDPAGAVITSLNLRVNGLGSSSPGGVDISPLFTVVDQLQVIDFSFNNLFLSSLNLTSLARLNTLVLPNIQATAIGFQPLLLPSPCRLSVLNLVSTSFAVDGWAACTALTQIDITGATGPVPLAIITYMPQLQQMVAPFSGLNGDAVGSYGGGLRGGELTLFVLAHLSESNPLLQVLDLGGGSLPFGLPNSTDNFPMIVASRLTRLSLSDLPLRTGPAGPANERWLSGLPSLTILSMATLPNVVVHTSAFRFATRSLLSFTCDSRVVGDLTPLFSLSSIERLGLTGSGLRSQLPSNLSAVWPNLSGIYCSGCNIWGSFPDFSNLPVLREVYLDRNSLRGIIGRDFAKDSPKLKSLLLSSNFLQGPLPSFCGCPSMTLFAADGNLVDSFPDLSCYRNMQMLQLQANPMQGQLADDLWQRLSAITTLVIGDTLLNGTIPDRDPTLPIMNRFLASNCRFTGPLPRNIDAAEVDLSQNAFSGPLILFDERFGGGAPQMTSLRLAAAGNLSCPIELAILTSLTSLVISGNDFAGCDYVAVTVPTTVTELDISENAWLPFDLNIPVAVISLQASRSNCRGLQTGTQPLPSLTDITLDGCAFQTNAQGVTVFNQLFYLLSSYGIATALRSFSCQDCDLSLSIGDLMPLLTSNPVLETIRLDRNQLVDEFPALLAIELVQSAFPPSIVTFSIAGNANLRGQLLPSPDVMTGLAALDFSSTAMTGSIPSTWANLPALSVLNIANTSLQCDLSVTPHDKLQCAEQPVLAASPTITIEAASLADPSVGVHCSALTIVATGSTAVTADPTFHGFTLCSCDSASFGLHARCYRCPEGCTCTADTIKNCFPVVQRGSISVHPASDSSGNRFVISGSIAPFSVSAVLPCPRTVTGSSLCNPDGVAWPSFYRIGESAEADSISASLSAGSSSASVSLTDSTLSSSSSESELDLSAWCYPGHTGRLCAACSNGYFSSGRWCLRCLSEGVHIIILCVNGLLIVALIAYLYAKLPSAHNAARSLQKYFDRLDGVQGDHSSHPMRSLNADGSVSAVTIASGSLSSVNGDAAAETPAHTVNPLKLLIFHSQQLSLLLHTSTSLPRVMAGLLSFLNSGSTGFSLSSLVALECLSSWTLSHRCWMAVVAPTIIGVAAGVTALISRKSGSSSRASRAMYLQGRDEPLLVAADRASEADGPQRSSSVVPRIYSVCVSLLYFLFFPCAQTVLSAVACTDTREVGRSYLNLSPDQACDDDWRRAVLPPAVLGLLFWVVAFPLGSTLLLLRLRSKLAGCASSASGSASAGLLSVWPVCADLVLPYSPRFWYWEQLLLLRRLLLVAAVTLIPSSSLYLPLVLFAIIQLSALLQHWAQPYAHSLLNAGELTSLYLLLINYISAIILQTGLLDGGFHATADGWAAALFVVNVAFLLVLVAGLFGWARSRLFTRWSRVSGRSA